MAFIKCHVCGKVIGDDSIFGQRAPHCRICGRPTCYKHLKDDVCAICREKLGKKS